MYMIDIFSLYLSFMRVKNNRSLLTFFGIATVLISASSDGVWLPFFKQEQGIVLEPKNKTIRTMSIDELRNKKQEHLVVNNKEIAIKYLEKMLPLCDDLQDAAELLLELANLFFELEQYPEAEERYREFCLLYPGNEQIEFTFYRRIVCSFKGILDPNRDQNKTYETIELVDAFLKRDELFLSYIQEIDTIRTQCRFQLFNSELSIITDYTQRNRYQSAHKRINHVKEIFFEEFPQHQHMVAQLEKNLPTQENVPLADSSDDDKSVTSTQPKKETTSDTMQLAQITLPTTE